MVTRELVDVAVDNDGHVVANVVGRAAGRVAFEVPPARRSAPGAQREAAVDEVPVEGRHARLAAGVDGAEGDVLEPLQVPDHLGRVQLSLGRDDRGHVRVGACVRCIHERLQPFHLLARLAHRRIMPPGATLRRSSTSTTTRRTRAERSSLRGRRSPRARPTSLHGMKQGRGGYVVLQRLRGEEWRVLGEADRSPGLPLGTFAVTQFGTSWGARQLQTEVFAVLPLSEWRLGVDS